MQMNLQQCLQIILGVEGGYVDNAQDHGGPTNHGITQATLSAWRKSPASVDDVKALGEAEAIMILRSQYALPIRFDRLPDGLDLCVLDAAVNSGPERAAEILQGLLGVAQDGIVGLLTLNALSDKDVPTLIHSYSQARLAFLRSLPNWGTFGKGWSSRLANIEHEAVELATGLDHGAKPDIVPGAQAKAPPVAVSPMASLIAAISQFLASLFHRPATA